MQSRSMRARRSLWGISLVGLIGCAGVVGGNLEILGEVSFDLKIPGEKVGKSERRPVDRTGHVTKAEPVECIYQYPETKQVNALLSNMMNHLTKMYVRVDNYLRSESRTTRKDNKRFDIVQKKRSAFFDVIYYNMTEEYRRFANHTQQHVLRANDPCEHQSEIRNVWRALLDSSQESVRRAALACVEECLRETRASGEGAVARAGKGQARARASQLLRREIARVRHDQLTLLCDKFQLCFNDLV